MKKLLLGCVLLLASMFSVARADNDTLYVRELTYQTLAFTGDTARTSDSLTISSIVLKDKRAGCYAKGYSFTLTDSALVNIYVATLWDGYLSLLSSDFQEIASNDDGCDGSCLTSLILEAGTYNVLVTGYRPFYHGSFDLVISKRIIPVAQTLTYTPMTFGQMLVDSLTEQSPLMLWVDNMLCFAKGYSITLTETAIVDMFLSADDDVEPDGEVPLPSVDAYFNDAHYIMDIPAGITHHVLEAGTHYIVVLYNYVEGEFSNAFRLSASLLNHPTVTPATLTYQPIALNQLAVDSLVEACPVLLSPRSRAGCYAKGYSFTATAGKVYSIAMPDSLTDFDSYLLLYDANNNLVDMNDDAHGGNKSLIVAELEAGTYHVVVTSYSAMEEGSYGLIITESTLQTYYVDPVAGNDENDGSTPALAKKDLQSAIGNADFMGVFYLMNDDTISATASVPIPIPMKKAYGGASIVHIYPYQRDIHFYGRRAAVRPNPGDDGGTVETPFNMFQADLFELGNPNDNYKIIFDSVNMPVHIVKGEDVRFNNVTVSNSSIASLTYRAGKFSMKNCVIANDTLSDSFISGYDVTLTGCTIDGNASEGIISVYSNDEEINGRLVVENTSIQNNRGNTPTLILYEANAELRSGTFNNNTCTIDTEHMPASVVEAFGMLSARNMGGIMAAYASTVSFGSAFSYDSEAYIILADSMSTVAVTENLSGSYAVLPFSTSESNGGTDYTLGFAEGRHVLSGTDAMMQANYSHFAVPQLTDVQWYVHPDGRIYSQRAGIEDASETMAISLYPNPAQYHLNIAGVEEGSMVRILDINGRVVSSTAVSGATSTLNVSGLAAGIYFVQVVKGNTSTTAKFIKQ